MTREPAIVAYDTPDGAAFGIGVGDGLIEVSRRDPRYPSLRALFDGDGVAGVIEQHGGRAPDLAITEVRLAAPVPYGAKILCVGVNYPDRAAEYRNEMTTPDYPSLFVRFAESLTGHDRPLIRPVVSEQLDYEGELVIVIGKLGWHLSKEAALDHVAALSIGNDGAVRDWMRHGKFNVTQGKNFAKSGAIGPGLVPFRGEAQIADIALTTRVNGEVRQNDRTSRMLFDVRTILSYITTFTPLAPGDVIFTGTPQGAGARFDPPVWLKPGDVVEVVVDGVGLLRNTVADEGVA